MDWFSWPAGLIHSPVLLSDGPPGDSSLSPAAPVELCERDVTDNDTALRDKSLVKLTDAELGAFSITT